MLHHFVGWLREARQAPARGRWARWLGRGWARLTYAVRVEPTWLELNRHDVPIADLPPAFHGFRIVQLSDFHCSRQVTPAYLTEAVGLAQAQAADVIVLTGDFVHKGYRHVSRVAEVLGRLHAPFGVYAVLGNHDYSVRNALGMRRYRHLHRAVADTLAGRGIRVLHNETVTLLRDQASLHLGGVADLWSRVCDLDRTLAGLSAAVPCVILAHNPCTVERLREGQRCDLMLSGHTHGGQINLPRLGRVTLSRQGKRFAAGLYQHQGTYLYVHKGVGFGFRVRYGVRPEVAVLRLQPATSAEALSNGAAQPPSPDARASP
jgi:predicted MPP superfamily phosphohydrolase